MIKKNKRIIQTTKKTSSCQEYIDLIHKIQNSQMISNDEINLIKTLIQHSIKGLKEGKNINNFFEEQIWNVQFTEHFLQKWIESDKLFIQICQHILLLANGNFTKKISKLSTFPVSTCQIEKYQGYFVSQMGEVISVLFEVGMARSSEIENDQFIGFNFSHKMNFLQLLKYQQCSDLNLIKQIIEENQKQCISNKLVHIKIVERKDKNQKLFIWNHDQNWSVLQYVQQSSKELLWYPNQFENYIVEQKELIHCDGGNNYMFQDEYDQNMIEIENEKILNQNKQQLVQYFQNFKFEKIIRINFTMIEIFLQKQQFTITKQELEVINTKTNALIIGRSGTGKTTCTIYRIIALQLQINLIEKRFMTQLNLLRRLNKQSLYDEDAQQSNFTIVFTSSNPLLVNEMRRYYNRFLSKIKNEKDEQSEPEFESLLQNFIKLKLSSINDQWSIDQKKDFLKIMPTDQPVIVSFNQFLLLLDNSLVNSLLKSKGPTQPKQKSAGWNHKTSGKQQEFQTLLQNQGVNVSYEQFNLSEVDYEVFCNQFWISLKKKNTQIIEEPSFCTLVWTQIYSVIKGSQYSHTYPNRFLPLQIYLNYPQQQKIDEKTLTKVYQFFLLYENWKIQQGKFDQMDIVNHIIIEFKKHNYLGESIHYLFVDEVQDFTQASLQLFILLAEQKIMLSGDTAQNIVKGVGFRFQDLKNQFFGVKEFSTYSLTTNFRSHNNILKLANNIVSIIELIFPKTIDFLRKEESDITGPKPTIIVSNDINQIIFLLQGQSDNTKLEFGCYQAVLAKSNNNIPDILKHLIVLTIQECKGLEFDDVILFNFFEDESVPQQQWDLLKFLFIEQENGVQRLRVKPNISAQDINLFTILCSELKYLYVAVTRARKRIFIYDTNPKKRAIIEQVWSQLDLINIFNLNENFEQQSSVNQVLLSKNSKKEWQEQGIKMFQMKFYEQAAKCFKYSEDTIMENQTLGYALATQAQKYLFEIEANQDNLQVKVKKGQIKMEKQQCYDLFNKAAEKFLQCNQPEQAAACYFSGKKYQNALQYYLKSSDWDSAIIAAEKTKDYLIAGFLQWRQGNYEKCLHSFELIENPVVFMAILKHLKQDLNKQIYQMKLNEGLPTLFTFLYKLNGKQIEFNIDFCNKWIQNFKLIFKNVLNAIFAFLKIPLLNNIIELIFEYINEFQDDILDLLEKIHINYNKQQFKQIFDSKDTTSIHYIKAKLQVLQDVLSYFKLNELLILLYDMYKINDRTKHVVSLLFQISYNSDISKKAMNKADTIQIVDVTPCNWNPRNYLQPVFQICQLGLQKTAEYLIIKLKKSNGITSEQIQYLDEDLGEISYLFFTSTNLEFINQIVHDTDQFYRNEEISSYEKLENIQVDQAIVDVLKKISIRQELTQFEIQDMLNTISDNFQTQNQITKKQLLQAINMLKIISKMILFPDHPILKQFDQLDHIYYQHFIRFIQVCIELFKYNQDITSQILCFCSICSVFSIRVPSKLTLNQLSQTVTLVHKDSILFKQNLITLAQSYQMEKVQQVYQFNSKDVFDAIKNYLRQFLKKYSERYLLKEQNTISRAPFLIQHYTYLRLKKQSTLIPEGIQKYQLFQEVYYDFFLEKCLKVQIIDSLYSMASQCTEPKLIITKRLLSELAMYYFFKGLGESDAQLMHNNIMIGICIQNIAHEQNISLRFIEHLQTVTTTDSTCYNDYINYMQITNFCFSLDACLLYFNFHQKMKHLLQPEQVLKDLTFMSLMLSCHSAQQIEQTLVLVPNTSLKLIQHNLIPENLYEIHLKIQEEEIYIKIQQLLIEAIFEQVKQDKYYSRYLRLLVSLLLNIKKLWDGLSDRLYQMADELEYEQYDQDFQLLAELALKERDSRREYLQPYSKFTQVQIKVVLVNDEQVENYLNLKYKRRAIEAHFINKMNYQYQESIKNKFANQYLGMRLLLFRPLSIQNGQITEKDIENKIVGKLYEKIDFLRRLLLSTLNSKLVTSHSHFHAITAELKLLSTLELDVDYYISKNERNQTKQPIEPENQLKDLQFIQEQIENWKKMNQELNDNISQLQYSFQVQEEEESKAYNLLLSRVMKILQ